MSLNWDISEIKNFKELCYVPAPPEDGEDMVTLNPTTRRIVFQCMAIGIGEITEKNAKDFAFRSWLLTALDNSTWEGNLEPVSLSDVVAHIGLKTNVTYESRAKWLSRMVPYVESEWLKHVAKPDIG